MNDRLVDLLANLFAFDVTADLLGRDFVQQALIAAALLALVAGLIGPFIVMRQMSFAVHGSSELSLTGAAFALLTGLNVGVGALVGSALAAVLFGILGQRTRERDSAIGVVLAFGLGLAVLFIHLYPGRTGTSFALLTGQIVGVGYSGLALLAVVTVVVTVVLAVCYRPAAVRHRRPRGGCGARRAGPRDGHRVRRHGGCGRRAGCADRRRAAGDVAVDHACRRGRAGVRLPRSHHCRLGGLRRDIGCRRHRVVAGARRAGFGVRHHDLVRDLRDLLAVGSRRSVDVEGVLAAFSTGRVASEDHSDHDPGYSAASMPSVASAATTTDAVTPEPQ